MLGGVRPLARHDGQPLDPTRLAWAGKPRGFTGGLFQARGDWAWYQQIFGFLAWNSKHICWRCKATSCDTMPYWDSSEGATWRTSRYTPGAFFTMHKGLQYQLSVHYSVVQGSLWTRSALVLCTVWTWGHSRSSWQHLQ